MSESAALTPTPPATPADASTSAEILLQARAVTRRFGGLVAVRDVDLDIPKGSIVSIIGPNGAGKTTFFNVVAGIIDPTAGVVRFRDRTLISRPHRTWLEPIAWVTPAILVLLVALALGAQGGGESAMAIAGIAVVGVLAATLLLAIVRPAWYTRLMDRFGVLRSARPNDVVAAGIGRTFQNIRLFQNMSALENVLVGMHLKLRSNLVDHMICPRASDGTRQRPPSGPASCWRWWGCEAARTSWRRTCPTATSDVSSWPGPWATTRSCSCSTSPPRA